MGERTGTASGTRTVAVRAAGVRVGVGRATKTSVVIVVVARTYVSLIAKACSANWLGVTASVTCIIYVTMRANSREVI